MLNIMQPKNNKKQNQLHAIISSAIALERALLYGGNGVKSDIPNYLFALISFHTAYWAILGKKAVWKIFL